MDDKIICDHCGMDIGTDGYTATVHRDGRVVRVHTFTAGCLAALKGRIADLEAENVALRLPGPGADFTVSSASTSGVIDLGSYVIHTDTGWDAFNGKTGKAHYGLEDEATARRLAGFG
jgi:hypothetical protein